MIHFPEKNIYAQVKILQGIILMQQIRSCAGQSLLKRQNGKAMQN